MKRSLISFCFLMVLHDPGLCQTTKAKPAFYIVLNSLTKTCTVVNRLPQSDTPNITLASAAIFQSRGEAEPAIRTVKPCNYQPCATAAAAQGVLLVVLFDDTARRRANSRQSPIS